MSDNAELNAYRFAEIKTDTSEILAQVKITNGRMTAAEKAIAQLQVAYGIGCALGLAGFYWLLGSLP